MATAQFDDRAALIRQKIEQLNAEFSWLIDHRVGVGVSQLFTSDGVYDMFNGVYRGRKEIDEFYTARKSRGERAARHVFTNLALSLQSEREATGSLILSLYAYDGSPPYPALPIMIADYNDVYMQDESGAWLYKSRTLVPVFGDMPVLTSRTKGR